MTTWRKLAGRARLRAWALNDLDAVGQLLGDPEVMRFSDAGPLSQGAAQDWLDTQITLHADPGPPWSLAICDADGPCGYVRLTDATGRSGPGDWELGVRLASKAWGRGLANSAARAVIESAAASSTVARVIAIIDPGNARSVRLVQRLGFSYDREVWFPGYTHADHLYARRP